MARIHKTRDMYSPITRRKEIWSIAIYIRLSKEDGNDESLSVTNQKKIILDYLENTFEGKYNLIDFYIDDGITGTDYDRPDFQRMLRHVEKGLVNCVICKNLSRAFRNYADQGYFLENYFPHHNTRFITISDPKVDSFLHPETIQNLEVPITGIMNDRFACKTSMDIRETFNTKRRKGEFIGSFAPYGYKKNPANKNHLIIDEEAAGVVKNIFEWFTYGGLSKNSIARKLNESGIPNPTTYKKQKGFRYKNPHEADNDGLWSPCSVTRILKNQMYIGNMVQGRQKVISYKVHDKVNLPEEEWFIKERTHDAIIDEDTFYKAQKLQQRNTRTSPAKRKLYLFSGFLRCADCKKALTRKQSRGNVYYTCRTYKEKSSIKCTKHSIREDILYEAVLTAIKKQIDLIGDLDEVIKNINRIPIEHTRSYQLNNLLQLRITELEKVTCGLDNLYLDWKSGEITKEDYKRMKEKFEKKAHELSNTIDTLNEQMQSITENECHHPYLDSFLKYRTITHLERGLLVELIDAIYVGKKGEIHIEFTFSDPYKGDYRCV